MTTPLDFSARPLVMAILNVTPDSFFDGGRYTSSDALLRRAETVLSEGADLLDLGGYSSRPGAADVSPDEELRRLSEACAALRTRFPEAVLSIDTFRADVAERLIADFDVAMINDISGGSLDAGMYPMLARHTDVCYVLMHMRGTPLTMQSPEHLVYHDLVGDISAYFSERIARLNALGVTRLILDPGFGFSKTAAQNFALLRRMNEFRSFRLPLLAGLSRKSMLYRTLGTSPAECLNATSVANTLALLQGAQILRVHDVREAVECRTLVQCYRCS